MTVSMEEVSGFEAFKERLDYCDPKDHVILVNAEHTTAVRFETEVRQAKGCVTDFDGTLHAGSQWDRMRECMRPHLAEQDARAVARYFAEPRTAHENIDLIYGSVDRLQASAFMRGHLVNHAHAMPPREGAVELLASFDGMTCIVSFGLADFIEEWCERFRVKATVAALRLHWHERARLDGYHPYTVVTDDNKWIMYDAFRVANKLPPSSVLVIGDAPTDIGMMRQEGLAVYVIPKFDGNQDRHRARMQALERVWPLVSAVLVSDSLEPLAELRRAE